MEAMKSAVQIGLGAAFVSAAVVEKEASLGTLAALRIEGLPLQRQLQCILDPSRWALRTPPCSVCCSPAPLHGCDQLSKGCLSYSAERTNFSRLCFYMITT